MQFKPGREGATGNGVDDQDKKVDVNLSLQPQDMNHWQLMMDRGDSIQDLIVESLKFDREKNVMSAQWRSEQGL